MSILFSRTTMHPTPTRGRFANRCSGVVISNVPNEVTLSGGRRSASASGSSVTSKWQLLPTCTEAPRRRHTVTIQYRQFTDSARVVWKVYRVEPGAVSASLARLRERLPDRESERRRPWLLFESSSGERRRLAPVPGEGDESLPGAAPAEGGRAGDPLPPPPPRRCGGEPATRPRRREVNARKRAM